MAWVGASWPLARLRVEPGQLTLTSLGKYTFAPQDVVALEPYGIIPLIGKGIRIRHNRQDYPEELVFWCLGGRDRKLADVARIFPPTGTERERAPGMAIRWTVLLIALVLWFVLPMLDPAAKSAPQAFGPGALTALALLFAVPTALRVSPGAQRLMLRPGRQASEIAPYLILLQIVSAILFTTFAIQALTV